MELSLILFKKNGTTKHFALSSTVTTVGRRQDCDLCIPLMVVSRRHCQINQDQGQLKIRDLGSRNGTFVNGQQIDHANLNPGDQLHIGPLAFAVQINGQPKQVPTPSKEPSESEDNYIRQKIAEQAQDFAGIDDVDIDTDHHETEILNSITELNHQ